ncbi:hypothetical protein GXW82_14935 [Streptacidiphilus sp. 4-A2]|nr:hypothetical protein [Streptacidiphilus sp. 4-A2]
MVQMQRRAQCRGGCPIGSLASELAEHDEQARADIAAGFERWHTAIRGGLDAMIALIESLARPVPASGPGAANRE